MNDAQQPLNALPQGYRLQEYELVRVLGFGGFGMTYLGFDHNLDKAVAIKEYLPSDIATRTNDNSVVPQASQFQDDFEWGLDRFLDEARALARFDHRHIIKVHRFFEAHGTAYIVMEYAEGETLSAFLARKRTLKESELKAILYPLMDGLEVVHRADFLHRDIKPGNIIIRDEDNSPVLLDFGSARQAIGARSRSVTSIITPGYAPIEQYSSRGDQGPWTDIYALGGVCYRALTGEVPDDATDRVRNDPLIPVSERCAGQVSAEFLSAIDWALAVNEADRPQSVGAWRVALREETGSSVNILPTGTPTAPPSKVQDQERDDAPPVHHLTKSKGKLFAAVACVIALWACAVYYYHYEYIPDPHRRAQEAERARQAAERQDKIVPSSLAAEQNGGSVKISDFPQGDLPGKKEKEEYKSASVASYKFYYGIGRPIDYRKARYAAFVEFEQGSSILGGASVLMMLYANGFGVERDLDLSIKLARLEVWGAPAAIEGRIAHLEELKTKSEGTPFDLCNDITSGFMMGVCKSILAEKAEVARKKDLRSLIESWSIEHQKAFITLMEYVDNFNGARSKKEIETSGSARAVKTMTEEEYLSKFLLASFRAFEEGFFPQYTQADFIEADKELNQVYSELRLRNLADEFPFGERLGVIQFENVRGVQRLWIKYRDAWVQFGSVKYPQVSPDSWKTWLTNERIKQLNSLGGTPGINPFLDSGKDIDGLIQEGFKSFKKY